MVNGKETFPLVPVAVGLYSTAFNIFNTALMFPFVSLFDRFLSRIGHSSADDKEDYSQPRYLDPRRRKDFPTGVAAVQKESGALSRRRRRVPGDRPRRAEDAPDEVVAHYVALDVLSREIRGYTAAMLQPDMPPQQADLLASLVEEEDWTASLGETLLPGRPPRRTRRSSRRPARSLSTPSSTQSPTAMRAITPNGADMRAVRRQRPSGCPRYRRCATAASSCATCPGPSAARS